MNCVSDTKNYKHYCTHRHRHRMCCYVSSHSFIIAQSRTKHSSMGFCFSHLASCRSFETRHTNDTQTQCGFADWATSYKPNTQKTTSLYKTQGTRIYSTKIRNIYVLIINKLIAIHILHRNHPAMSLLANKWNTIHLILVLCIECVHYIGRILCSLHYAYRMIKLHIL